MMGCSEVTPVLWAYHLGACSELERDGVDSHLLGCRTCLESYLKHKRMTEDAAAFDERPSAHVHARLREVVAARAPRRLKLVWAMAAAAALLAFALGMQVQRSAPLQTPQSPAGTGFADALPLNERF
jgi:hypothetical protein